MFPFTADETTQNWPVTDTAFVEALHAVWTTHKVLLLPVYDERGRCVEPSRIFSTLRGALVELHFSLRHYFIRKETGNYDTFMGSVKQIVVLKRGAPEVKSLYRKDIHKGVWFVISSLLLPRPN